MKKIKDKKTNGVKANVSRGEICPTHKPLELGYLAWHTEAERRTKRGMKQKQCPKCLLWLWKDEM